MPIYNCKTLTPQGQVIRTRVEDESRIACIRKLRNNGLTPISVTPVASLNKRKKERQRVRNIKQFAEVQNSTVKKKNKKSKNSFFSFLTSDVGGSGKKISARDIRIFTQNFYLLKKANFNNIHALSTVISTTENVKLRIILEDILAGVEAGEYMYTTMEYYEDIFPYIYINMIKVGELSGSLERSLEQAVKYLEDNDALRRKIRRILLPNLLMFFGLIIGTILAVIFGVPMLKGIFESVGSNEQLPKITMWLYEFTLKVKSVWYIPVGLIIFVGIAFGTWISTSKGRYKFDYFKYTMPIFGKLMYLLDFSRVMQGVLLNLQNGMRIQDSLEVSKNVVKNTVMMSIIETSVNNIYIGQSWIQPFEEANLGDDMCIEMLKIGMQTDLSEMIEKMLAYIDADINNTLQTIVKVLPEISYLFVGIVLIFFVCAVLVPCISLYMGGWLFSAYDV